MKANGGVTVYKYQLGVGDLQSVEMPRDAQILTVQVQRGTVCLWALVDPDAALVTRRIRIAGTGHVIEGAHTYIGTVQQMGGALVWHVFEVESV